MCGKRKSSLKSCFSALTTFECELRSTLCKFKRVNCKKINSLHFFITQLLLKKLRKSYTVIFWRRKCLKIKKKKPTLLLSGGKPPMACGGISSMAQQNLTGWVEQHPIYRHQGQSADCLLKLRQRQKARVNFVQQTHLR